MQYVSVKFNKQFMYAISIFTIDDIHCINDCCRECLGKWQVGLWRRGGLMVSALDFGSSYPG